MRCAWKTCTNKIGLGRRFYGVKCKRKYFVDQRRKKLKQMAIAYKGGACQRCGYAACEAALTFHHTEPARKDLSLSGEGMTRSWQRVRAELDKCILLCANCHAEIHSRQHVFRSIAGECKHWVNSANVRPTNAEPSPERP